MKKTITILSVAIFLLPALCLASFNQNLSYGSSGPDVINLQDFLISKGFMTGSATGNFYNLTKQAVISYQSSVGLPDTGYVGALTRAQINASLAQTNVSSVSAQPKAPVVQTFTTPSGAVIDSSGNVISVPVSLSQPVVTTQATTQTDCANEVQDIKNSFAANATAINADYANQLSHAQMEVNTANENVVSQNAGLSGAAVDYVVKTGTYQINQIETAKEQALSENTAEMYSSLAQAQLSCN